MYVLYFDDNNGTSWIIIQLCKPAAVISSRAVFTVIRNAGVSSDVLDGTMLMFVHNEKGGNYSHFEQV